MLHFSRNQIFDSFTSACFTGFLAYVAQVYVEQEPKMRAKRLKTSTDFFIAQMLK